MEKSITKLLSEFFFSLIHFKKLEDEVITTYRKLEFSNFSIHYISNARVCIGDIELNIK